MISGAVPFFTLPDVIVTKGGDAEDSGGSTHTYTGATTTGPITFVVYTNENRTNPRRDVTSMQIDGNAMQEIASQSVGGSLDGYCKIFVVRGAFSNADIVAVMDGATDNSAITYGSMQNNYDLLSTDADGASGTNSSLTWSSVVAARSREVRLFGLAFGGSTDQWAISPGVEMSDINGGDHRHFAGYAQTETPTDSVTLQTPGSADTITSTAAVFK